VTNQSKKSFFVIAIFIFLFYVATSALSSQEVVSPSATPQSSIPGAAEFSRASQVEDLRLGSPPFKLTIKFSLPGVSGNPSGIYAREYDVAQRWREELVVPPYKRTEWGGPGGYWRERDAPSEPSIIRSLDRLITYALIIKQHSEITFTGVKHGKLEGKPVNIVEGKWRGNVDWKYYFDDSTNLLLRIEFPNSYYAYSNFQPFGNKLFPRSLQMYVRGTLVIDAKVTDLADASQSDPSLFVPSSQAEFHPACENMRWPEVIEKQDGLLPASAAAHYLAGDSVIVRTTAIVDTSGTVKDPAIARTSGNADVDRTAIDVVRNWKYKPAMCGNDPLALEIEIPVRLSR
jgi:TonB family protein